jgi:ACS family hexuronate transporter-like MFS transporter
MFAGLSAGISKLSFTLVIGALGPTIGYAPFFVALGFGDLIGVVLLWTLVRPGPVNRPTDPGSGRPANAWCSSQVS